MSDYVFVDSETGSLDPRVSGITEIAAVAFNLNGDYSVTELEYYQTFVQPNPELAYTPFALKLQGRTLEELSEIGIPEAVALNQLSSFLSKHLPPSDERMGLIWGQNAQFDHGFLKALEERCGGGKRFPYRCDWSCTKTLWQTMRGLGIHNCRKSGQTAIADHYGVAVTDEHSALADARVGMQIVGPMLADMETYFARRVNRRKSGISRTAIAP